MITAIAPKNYHNGIMKLERAMSKLPNVLTAKDYPLKHSFAEGMYVREISVPKGHLVITKIHKHSHPCFVLKGDCSVMSETGPRRIKAPYYMITPAGTKRVVYVHEDTVWVTVHKTDHKDLEEIEKDVIATSFKEINTIDVDYKIQKFIEEVV